MSTSTEAGGHTPGPWICSSHDFVRTQKGDAIACVYSGNDSEGPGKNIEAEAANARLIASAPSLLAELATLKASNAALVVVVEKLAEWNHKYPTERIYSEGEIRSIAAEMDAINAEGLVALSRARGES